MNSAEPERVGVRALREKLSSYLRRVREGATLEVTDHGRPVARLSPIPVAGETLDSLIASGRARPARGSIDDLLPTMGKPNAALSRALQRALDEQKEDRI